MKTLAFFILLCPTCVLSDESPPRLWWWWASQTKPRTPVTLPASCGLSPSARIVGGSPSEEHAWSWVASLRTSGGRHFCGGTLVSVRHVVTAAHCVKAYRWFLSLLHVVVRGGNGSAEGVSAVAIHPQYRRRNVHDYDLAVLTLKRDLVVSASLPPACLPLATTRSSGPATVVGWGRLQENGTATPNLHEALVEILPHESCRAYGELYTDSMLCGGGEGQDACQGDSGGPLLQEVSSKWYLVGVVSFGKGCGRPDYPGVYADVSKSTKWITSIVSL
ncbi:transmembrane protease serine 6-like [Penaeus japonicus]|uniref:transmembrane protease serine 6-like n=1 Tax=Penaeus japonicus TaxID=27405 RepID=UPI001C70FDF1|nr:transmembrane protease serine 6-like [Penaeus japonicus]